MGDCGSNLQPLCWFWVSNQHLYKAPTVPLSLFLSSWKSYAGFHYSARKTLTRCRVCGCRSTGRNKWQEKPQGRESWMASALAHYGFQLFSRPHQPLGWPQIFDSLKQNILKPLKIVFGRLDLKHPDKETKNSEYFLIVPRRKAEMRMERQETTITISS